MDAIEKLTKLQNAVGYKQGIVNPIALLGLYGEAGEILGETQFTSTIKRPEDVQVAVNIHTDQEMAFDIEVADALYYLNAIAIGRGKTLADYAEISYQKVSKKTQINIEETTSHTFASLPPADSMVKTADDLGLSNPRIFIPLGPKEDKP